MTLPLKQLAIFLAAFVFPASAMVFIRYYRTVPRTRRRSLLLYGVGTALLLMGALLTIAARIAGWPPIWYASRTGWCGLEKHLIALGVDVNARDPYTGWDPLTHAAWNGDLEMAALLITAGARVYDASNREWPALMYAAMQGNTDLARMLLERVDDQQGKKVALCFAARHGHVDTLTLLLDGGADMQSKGRLCKTPLEEACEAGQLRIIRLLVERARKEVMQLESCGNALIAAAREEDLSSLQWLLDRGVDVNYQGYAKWTALMSAVQKGSPGTVDFLLAHGADPNIRDTQGRSRESRHEGSQSFLSLQDNPPKAGVYSVWDSN